MPDTMDTREKVALWLRRRPLKVYCDECLGTAVGSPDLEVGRAAIALAATGSFARKDGLCTLCGADRPVTSAK